MFSENLTGLNLKSRIILRIINGKRPKGRRQSIKSMRNWKAIF